MQRQCNAYKGCPTGEARLTTGCNLPAKYIIHAVGPQGERPLILSRLYSYILNMCRSHNIRSVAIPCISTGLFKYPNRQAARVALGAIRESFNRDGPIRVILSIYTEWDRQLYDELLPFFFPLQEAKIHWNTVATHNETNSTSDVEDFESQTEDSPPTRPPRHDDPPELASENQSRPKPRKEVTINDQPWEMIFDDNGQPIQPQKDSALQTRRDRVSKQFGLRSTPRPNRRYQEGTVESTTTAT